jgi:hypothetical protein
LDHTFFYAFLLKNISQTLNFYFNKRFSAGVAMALDWKTWSRNDLINGVIIPVLVILLIVLISKLPSLFGGGFGVVTGIVMELEELVVVAGVPLVLGLVWNRWAGGASGFLLGSIYALYWANSYHGIRGSGTVLIAYILSAMLIGYMAGALNKRSENFLRMVISGVVAGTIGGVMLFGIFQLSTANVVTGIDGFLLTVLTRTAVGAVVAVIAKIFMWYGVSTKNPNT